MTGRLTLWRFAVLAVGSIALVTACGTPQHFQIYNDTATRVELVGCAQEPDMHRLISSRSTFTFSDNVGERTLSDDAGFACLLTTGPGELRCLRMPTDQSTKTRFAVSEARPADSFATCVAHSDPHL